MEPKKEAPQAALCRGRNCGALYLALAAMTFTQGVGGGPSWHCQDGRPSDSRLSLPRAVSDSAPTLSRPWLLSMVFLSPRDPPSPWMTSGLCADHPSNTQLDSLVSSDLEPPHPLTKPQIQSSSQSSSLNRKFKFPLQQCSPLLAHPTLIQLLFFHVCVHSVAQSCPALCDPMDCSLPGSSVHRIFQATANKSVLRACWGCYSLTPKFFPTCYILPSPPSISSFRFPVWHANHSVPKIQQSLLQCSHPASLL